MPSMLTAVIYTRVSTEDQAGGTSLEAQLAEARRYAAQKGWVLGPEYTDVMSGKRDDRPQYQAMLAHVRAERTNGTPIVVVVAALDRLGRRLIERVRSREELKRIGVSVHSVRDGGEVSDFVANILAAVAEEESNRTGQRVTRVRAHLREGGWWTSGRIAWGYLTRDATDEERRQGAPRRVLDVDEYRAPFVREAYERAAKDSVRSVMRWVATLPDDVREGRSMPYYVVRLMLIAPIYIARSGMAVPVARADEVLERPIMNWPALVTDEQWLAVSRRIDSHKVLPRQATNRYLLSGIVRCPTCDGRMNGTPGYGYRSSYRCLNNLQRGVAAVNREMNCHGSAVCEEVDNSVIEQVSALVSTVLNTSPKLRSELARAWKDRQRGRPVGDTHAHRIKGLQQDIAKAEARIKQSALLFVDGEIDRAGYEHARDAAQADLQRATDQLDALRAEEPRRSRPKALPPLDEVLKALDTWTDALTDSDVAAQRDVTRALCQRIVPRKLKWRRYAADIEWTPLGQELHAVLTALQDSA